MDDGLTAPKRRGRVRRRIGIAILAFLVGIASLGGYVAVVPVSLPVTVTAPDPSATFADALARFAQVQAREAALDLLPECRSDMLSSGQKEARAIVLFHGYTNCPRQMQVLGAELRAAGFNVYIPRAPEHGGADQTHSTLAELTSEKLMAYGDEAVDIATGLGDQVTVLGLSGGGTVASYVAQTRGEVDLAVLAAPFFALKSFPEIVTHALVNLAAILPSIGWLTPESSVEDGTLVPYATRDNSTKSGSAYMRLGVLVLSLAAERQRAAARSITVVNDNDDTVNNEMSAELTARWSALAPETTSDYLFDAALGIPHDMIGPDRSDEHIDIVYPELLRLVGVR